MTTVEFRVYGVPVAQGSKRYVNAGGKPSGIEMGKGHGAWRNDVSAAAAQAKADAGLVEPLDGALKLGLVFRFPMPRSRPKNDRLMRYVLKTSTPDTSKLVRAVEDSLTAAALIRDDARVAVLHVSKLEVFDDWTGVEVCVETLNRYSGIRS